MATALLRLIAAVQLLLGTLYLLAPHWLLAQMGHSAAAPDLAYPLGMLAARFVAYGAGLWWVAPQPQAHGLWIRLMALIQLIDLGVGLTLTLRGVLPWSLSGFPMFNAVWIAAVCWWLGRPAAPHRATVAA
jgi:hypothetical protein